MPRSCCPLSATLIGHVAACAESTLLLPPVPFAALDSRDICDVPTVDGTVVRSYQNLSVRVMLRTACGSSDRDSAFDLIHACWLDDLVTLHIHPFDAPGITIESNTGETHYFDTAVRLLVQIPGAPFCRRADETMFYINYDSAQATRTLIMGLHTMTRRDIDISAVVQFQNNLAQAADDPVRAPAGISPDRDVRAPASSHAQALDDLVCAPAGIALDQDVRAPVSFHAQAADDLVGAPTGPVGLSPDS